MNPNSENACSFVSESLPLLGTLFIWWWTCVFLKYCLMMMSLFWTLLIVDFLSDFFLFLECCLSMMGSFWGCLLFFGFTIFPSSYLNADFVLVSLSWLSMMNFVLRCLLLLLLIWCLDISCWFMLMVMNVNVIGNKLWVCKACYWRPVSSAFW